VLFFFHLARREIPTQENKKTISIDSAHGTGGFWLTFGFTLTPFYNAAGAYDPSNPANPGFHTSYGELELFSLWQNLMGKRH
jgi:hypothetical protein